MILLAYLAIATYFCFATSAAMVQSDEYQEFESLVGVGWSMALSMLMVIIASVFWGPIVLSRFFTKKEVDV